jgi:hypothetical protein
MLSQFDTPLARFTRIPVEDADEEEGEPRDGGERELLAPNEYEGDVLVPGSNEGKTNLSTCVLNLLEYDSVQCQKGTAKSLVYAPKLAPLARVRCFLLSSEERSGGQTRLGSRLSSLTVRITFAASRLVS